MVGWPNDAHRGGYRPDFGGCTYRCCRECPGRRSRSGWSTRPFKELLHAAEIFKPDERIKNNLFGLPKSLCSRFPEGFTSFWLQNLGLYAKHRVYSKLEIPGSPKFGPDIAKTVSKQVFFQSLHGVKMNYNEHICVFCICFIILVSLNHIRSEILSESRGAW